jgi:bifunctional NMN adenylyltransferase/nudix hydrolase
MTSKATMTLASVLPGSKPEFPKSDTQPYDYLVFIGRFEPFHNGHQAVVEKALKRAKKVIVLIGSAKRPRNIRNPWLIQERIVMIRHAFGEEEQKRLLFAGIPDSIYNDEQWNRAVQQAVREAIHKDGGDDQEEIGLIGHEKDLSSSYLSMFPQWDRIEAPNVDGLSASAIRDYLFSSPNDEGNLMLIESAVPRPVFQLLQSFRQTPHFQALVREYDFVRNYRNAWANVPYSPTFVTVDAVVVHSGHILLVKRGAMPGEGLWALPGGFIGHDERILDACIRELREETRLKIPAPVLKGSIKTQRVFDHPDRSLRGRTITHAFLFDFPMGELPEIKGGDDAAKARWIALAEFADMQDQLYEDHFDIASYFMGTI